MKQIFSLFNIILALVVVMLINVAVLLNPFRFDSSDRGYYSLSEITLNLLDDLEKEVEVTVFFREEHDLYHDIENLLAEYQYRSRNIHVQWVDPVRDRSRTEKLVSRYGLADPKNPQVVVVEIDGRSKVLVPADIANLVAVKGLEKPMVVSFKGEQAFSSAIQGLVQGKAPMVYMLVGHGERRITDFDQITGLSRVGTAMIRDNVELKELLLTNEKKIPADAAALVIAGPSKAMSAAEVQMVEDYLRRSGRVMILLDALQDPGLEPMLRRWSVGIRNDFVLDPDNTLNGSDVYVKTYYEHPITLRLAKVGARFYLPRSVVSLQTGSATGVADDRPVVTELAVTSEKSWSETQVEEKAARFDENTGDRRGPFSLAVAVEKGSTKGVDVHIHPSRMVVFGDSDFICNGLLSGGNQDLFMSAMNWLLDREELMAIASKPIEEVRLDLTRQQLNQLAWLVVGGIPALAVVGGLFIWMRRRK